MAGYTHNFDDAQAESYTNTSVASPLLVSVPEGSFEASGAEYGAAIVTEPDNVHQIKIALLQLYQDHKAKTPMKPHAGVRVEQHRRDYLTEQLTKEFNLRWTIIFL